MNDTPTYLLSYPPGVISYAMHFKQLYNDWSRLRMLCENFNISQAVLVHAMAEAAQEKLLKTHDVTLSRAEIGDAIAKGAIASYMERRMSDVGNFTITASGALDFEATPEVETGLREIHRYIYDWAHTHC